MLIHPDNTSFEKVMLDYIGRYGNQHGKPRKWLQLILDNYPNITTGQLRVKLAEGELSRRFNGVGVKTEKFLSSLLIEDEATVKRFEPREVFLDRVRRGRENTNLALEDFDRLLELATRGVMFKHNQIPNRRAK